MSITHSNEPRACCTIQLDPKTVTALFYKRKKKKKIERDKPVTVSHPPTPSRSHILDAFNVFIDSCVSFDKSRITFDESKSNVGILS